MPTVQAAPSPNASRLKQARQWHLYLGTLFAPTILFFAFTGTLQIFSLHEGRPGGTYQPPAWIARMASIHKNQNIDVRRFPPPNQRRAPGEPGSQAGPAQQPDGPRPPRDFDPGRGGRPQPGILTYLLKWFFVFAALGLIWTTFLGIYMSFKYNRSRTVVWSLLIAGTAIPASLVLLMALSK